MKKKLLLAALLITIFGLLCTSSLRETLGSDYSFASNYDRVYTFYVQYGGYRFSQKLYTSITPSLYENYRSKSHMIYDENSYSRFVTPSAFKPIAESIQTVTRNFPYSEEQFANAVLMLVRHVSYVKSNVKYPVEAMVENSGDCDVLSLLAASIMKAGGLDVVLLYYKGLSISHMNVGVHLPYTPVCRTQWIAPTSYEHNGKKYWVAECTSRVEWKVGDSPELLAYAEPQIISLENCEKSSPAHVAANLGSPLIPSFISINIASENTSVSKQKRALTISGSISPAYPEKNVSIYVSKDGYSFTTFRTVTDQYGKYSFTWNFTSTGTYYIKTSWSGVSNYAGSDSETLTVFVGRYKPLDEFEELKYYWSAGLDDVSARANAAGYKALINRSVKEFLTSSVNGAGISLSGEFIILRNGSATSKNERTIIIPGYTQTIRFPRSRQAITIVRKEQIITIPAPNNQFSLVLKNNGGNNYTVSIKVLGDYELSQVTKRLDGGNAAVMNVSTVARENTWYKVVARLSDGEVTAELYDENGTLFKKLVAKDDPVSFNELVFLMDYDTETIVSFRGLKIEPFDRHMQPVGGNQIFAFSNGWKRCG